MLKVDCPPGETENARNIPMTGPEVEWGKTQVKSVGLEVIN